MVAWANRSRPARDGANSRPPRLGGHGAPAFFARHADRIKAIHVKDIRVSVAEATRGVEGIGYREVVGRGISTQPGRGDLDLRGAMDALGPGFSGWAIVEVDAPDLPTAQESARASGAGCRSLSEVQ